MNLDTIKRLDNLYCLNDLHKASGGANKHRPTFFLRRDETKKLIKAIEQNSNVQNRTVQTKCAKSHGSNIAVMTVEGSKGGTFVCRELVYVYAMWISAEFYLTVIRVFDNFVSGTLSERINAIAKAKDSMTATLSQAGYILAVGGKQVKPKLERELLDLLQQQSPELPLNGGVL